MLLQQGMWPIVVSTSDHLGRSNGKSSIRTFQPQRRSREALKLEKKGPRLAALLLERSAIVKKQQTHQHSSGDAPVMGDYGISTSGIKEWPRVIGKRQGGAPKVAFVEHARASSWEATTTAHGQVNEVWKLSTGRAATSDRCTFRASGSR